MRAEIRRPVNTFDANGKVILQSWRLIVPEHNIDLMALSHSERFNGAQLKINVSHSIFPELRSISAVQLGDFYFAGDSRYNIIEKNGAGEFGYFRVWSDDSGDVAASAAQDRNYFQASGLIPGAYTFGSGSLASIDAFSSVPIQLFTKKNAGSFYVPAKSATGFTLGDKGLGDIPQVDVAFWESIGTDNGGMWMFSGLAPGSYSFGVGSLAGMPCHISPAPDVVVVDENTGRGYVYNITSSGFNIGDAGIGDVPSVSVVIWEKPKTGENRWSVASLSPGAHTFGSGSFADVKGLVNAPDIYPYNTNAGDHYLTNISTSGFTLNAQGFGEAPNVNVIIVKK